MVLFFGEGVGEGEVATAGGCGRLDFEGGVR